MQHPLLKFAGVTALAAGMAFGQNAPANDAHSRGARQFGKQDGGSGMILDRLSADLNLTDAQKQQAQSIFSSARQSSESVHAQLRQQQQALTAAVKAGALEAEIDRLSNSLAPLFAQTTAIHSKAFAKFYAILTPEQKDKLGDRLERMMDGVGAMRGRWQGGNHPQSDRPSQR